MLFYHNQIRTEYINAMTPYKYQICTFNLTEQNTSSIIHSTLSVSNVSISWKLKSLTKFQRPIDFVHALFFN